MYDGLWKSSSVSHNWEILHFPTILTFSRTMQKTTDTQVKGVLGKQPYVFFLTISMHFSFSILYGIKCLIMLKSKSNAF